MSTLFPDYTPESPARVRADFSRGSDPRRVLLVIDGNSLAHRAWHAYPGLTNAAGEPTGVFYGFLALLCGICDMVRPDALLVGLDDASRNERRVLHPPYKGTRSEKDPALVSQLGALGALLDSLGVAQRTVAGWEADDVLGSAAASAAACGWRSVLATSDRDSFQLLDESTSLLRLRNGLDSAERLDPEALVALHGITPVQYLEYAALRGDASDNLPGARGVGEKTASRLLSALGNLETVWEDLAAGGERVREAAGKACVGRLGAPGVREIVELNTRMMRIRRDLDLGLGSELENATLELQHTRVSTACERWELPSLRGRLEIALGSPATREALLARDAETAAVYEAGFSSAPPEWEEWSSTPNASTPDIGTPNASTPDAGSQGAVAESAGGPPVELPEQRSAPVVMLGVDDLFGGPAPWARA